MLISHPDEIEKKKHFIGQAIPHGRTQTIKLNAKKRKQSAPPTAGGILRS
jgi:hypothetical protein